MKLHGKEHSNNDFRKLTNSPNFPHSHLNLLFTNQWPKEGGEIKQKQNIYCLQERNWSKWNEREKIRKSKDSIIKKQWNELSKHPKHTKNKDQKISESIKIRKPQYHIITELTNLQCRNGRSQNRTKTCNCWEGWDRIRSAPPGSLCIWRSHRIQRSSSRSSLTPSSTTKKKRNRRPKYTKK